MITSAKSTNDQPQTRRRARLAIRASTPAADKPQDRLVIPVSQAGFRQATHLLPRGRRHLPGRAIAAAPGLFIQAIDRSTGLRPHTFEHQPPVKLIAAAPSHHQVLSSVASSDAFKTIGKAFADGQNLFARGSKND